MEESWGWGRNLLSMGRGGGAGEGSSPLINPAWRRQFCLYFWWEGGFGTNPSSAQGLLLPVHWERSYWRLRDCSWCRGLGFELGLAACTTNTQSPALWLQPPPPQIPSCRSHSARWPCSRSCFFSLLFWGGLVRGCLPSSAQELFQAQCSGTVGQQGPHAGL